MISAVWNFTQRVVREVEQGAVDANDWRIAQWLNVCVLVAGSALAVFLCLGAIIADYHLFPYLAVPTLYTYYEIWSITFRISELLHGHDQLAGRPFDQYVTAYAPLARVVIIPVLVNYC